MNMEPVKFCEKTVLPSKSRVVCAVPGCSKKRSENANLSFHLFPAPKQQQLFISDGFGNIIQIDRYEAWKSALKLTKVSNYAKVCSLHFTNEDYYLPDIPAKNRILKKNAIPSCNLPGEKIEINKARQQRILKRNKNKNNKTIKEEQLNYSTDDFTDVDEKPPELQSEHESFSQTVVCQNVYNSNTTSRVPPVSISEKVVNTDEQNCEDKCEDCGPVEPVPGSIYLNNELVAPEIRLTRKIRFIDHLHSNKDLNTATGIKSFKILNNIVELMMRSVGQRFEKKPYIMETRDRILMTYVKLKQNLSYSFLALMFNVVSSQQCKNIFCETVQTLSGVLKEAIRWPSKEEIKSTLPECFQGFENIRVILNCIEISIQCPKRSCCEMITNSYCKDDLTTKVMTGITPAGDISFVSKPYTESDSKVFEPSALMRLVESEDIIIEDQKFSSKNQCKYAKPPHLEEKSHFTSLESMMTTKVAEARTHIEESNQRIRNFNIVESTMPIHLVRYVENIIVTICATVNLSLQDEFKKNFI